MTDAFAIFLAYSVFMTLLIIVAKPTWARVCLMVFWMITYSVINSSKSAEEPVLPDEFILVAAIVQEPRGTYPGQIWLWVRTKEDPLSPKSYSLPYDKDAAVVVRGWIKKIGGGKAELGVNLNATPEQKQEEQPKQQERIPRMRLPDERDA